MKETPYRPVSHFGWVSLVAGCKCIVDIKLHQVESSKTDEGPHFFEED